jgi:hypothetical protein
MSGKKCGWKWFRLDLKSTSPMFNLLLTHHDFVICRKEALVIWKMWMLYLNYH